MKHVFLGRFAPFHEGHRMLLTKLIDKFGLENCLVIIGSSNVIDERTPFTPVVRKKMIENFFPNIETVYLEDANDDDLWLKSLKDLEISMNTKFKFYGGSQKDLEILKREFDVEVLIDRQTEGRGITATKIREQLKHLR